MYKFAENKWDSQGLLIVMQLYSNKWNVSLREKNGHIHVTVSGPNGYRKQGLSNVKSDLRRFELKVAALYFYGLARDHANHKAYGGYAEPNWIDETNYASIFGSCFD